MGLTSQQSKQESNQDGSQRGILDKVVREGSEGIIGPDDKYFNNAGGRKKHYREQEVKRT